MNKIACAALLIAVFLKAQTGPAAQDTAPATEVAPQGQPPAAGAPRREQPFGEDITKKLRDLGYFNSEPLKSGPFGEDVMKKLRDAERLQSASVRPTRCAIPLLPIPVPDVERFASRIIPANPSIDPKIVSVPPLPACPQSAALPTIRPPEPSADKR